MTKVKICGITNLGDAMKACDLGADFLGFIFVKGTPRVVDKGTVKEIVNLASWESEAHHKPALVGLFKNEDLKKVAEIVISCGLDHVQLHGDESPDYCAKLKNKVWVDGDVRIKVIKVFKVKEEIKTIGKYSIGDYEKTDFFVFDTYHPEVAGGTGKKFNWEALNREKERINKPFFIAGGLNPENVSEAVKTVSPYGVDVSSGVEKAPGVKDEKLLKEFIENAKKA
ncbi:MAG: phosphoribosylanthranilate isomerase [Candidatus Omnitrophota bacterium]